MPVSMPVIKVTLKRNLGFILRNNTHGRNPELPDVLWLANAVNRPANSHQPAFFETPEADHVALVATQHMIALIIFTNVQTNVSAARTLKH